MPIGSANGYGNGMLWGLLGSFLLHVLVVYTIPGFKDRFDDQRDILTVQIDPAPEPERVQMSEPVPEKVIEPTIPSPPEITMPVERRIQPEKQPDRVPTEIVPPVPRVQRESTPENIPVLQAPQRTSSVSVQQPEIDNPTERKPDNNRTVLHRSEAPVQPVIPIEPMMPLEPKVLVPPQVVAPRPAPPQPAAPVEPKVLVPPQVVAPRPAPPQPAAPVEPKVLVPPQVVAPRPAPPQPAAPVEPKVLVPPQVVAPRPAPPQPAAPVEPKVLVPPQVVAPQPAAPVETAVDSELELEVVEEYRRAVHASLQALLQRDVKRNRSKVDAKHKGSKFKISLEFNAQGKIIEWKVAKKSEFKRLDNYYLKLIKRLVDDGAFPAPPVERLTTTVVIIPIEIK